MSPPSPLRVLLVDDDRADAILLRTALRAEGRASFTIRTRDRLGAAVAAMDEEPVDVVLLDLGLPDSTGLSTYEAFKAAAPDATVVILTNLGDDEVAIEAVRRGAQDYVVKGTVDELQLARTVRHAAERGRLKAELEQLADRQAVLAGLGRLASEGPPLSQLSARAAELTGRCLEARLALIVQRRADGRFIVQTSVGDEHLAGELLPPLLASQLSLPSATEPLVVADLSVQEIPALRDTPKVLREANNLVAVPVTGVAWTGAMVLLDTGAVRHDSDTMLFLRSVGSLLEEALRRERAEFDLQERAKELAALSAVGRLLQEQAPEQDLLRAVALAVVDGMQFPHHAVARIQVDDVVVISDRGRPTLAEELTAAIVVDGERRGEVAVGHRAVHGFIADYEQQLVDVIAETLALWLERNDNLARIRHSEAQLRSVLEQMPGLMWTVDTGMRIQRHAGRGHEHLRVRPNERAGRLLTDVFAPDHPILEAARDALAGQASSYESERDGRNLETYVEPMRAESGEIVGAIGMAVDVTGTVRARRELTESRRRLEGLFNHAHDGFLLVDDNGRSLDANPAVVRLTGYSVDELRGMTVADLSADPQQDDATVAFPDLREGGRVEGEWRLRRADGGVIETRFQAVADIVPGVHLSILTDITEHKRAEAALRRSEERFRRLAENAQDVIYRYDVTTGSFEYISPAVQELVGCAPEQFYADPSLALALLDPPDRDVLARSVHEAGAQTTQAAFIGRVRRSDGGEVWVEERHSYVRDEDGRHVATEGVVRDITARKRVEDELRAGLEEEQATAEDLRTLNEMKDVFLTAVSHELRTPLTSLKGMSHTLRQFDERLRPEQRSQLLDRMAANADRLQSLLEDLLDLDRMTRGVGLLDRREVDLAELVGRVLEGLPANGHTVTSQLQPVRAVLDEAKIERVVENLTLNAVRHTPANGRVWVVAVDEGAEVVIRVEDDGPGVPAHLRERIFEAFEMGDSPAARVGGLGIGLNLVARIVDLHDGSVTVDEREGGGASFVVRLPKHLDLSAQSDGDSLVQAAEAAGMT